MRQAEALLRAASGRLKRSARPAAVADLSKLEQSARGTRYRLPLSPEAHRTATDPVSCRIVGRGSLYPAHVIFLGSGVTIVPEEKSFNRIGEIVNGIGEAPPMLLVPGAGVLMSGNAPAGADELARCLADVTARIGADDDPVFLTAEEETELVDWEAERYRKALNVAAPSA